MREPKVKRVILCPDLVRSKHDGDRHFLSASQLAHLYGVLPTDIVKTYDGRKHAIPYDQQQREGWIELWPRKEGDYYNIHEHDEHDVIPMTDKEWEKFTKKFSNQ